MADHSNSIDATDPANADDAGDGASEMRDIKTEVDERMSEDHHWGDSITDTVGNKDGRHRFVRMIESANKPSTVTGLSLVNTGGVYTKDDGGDTELFYEDDGAAEVQLTKDGDAIADAVIETGASTSLKCKVIDIGDWNMDSTTQVDVAHGLSDFKKVRSVSAIIRDDTDVLYCDFATCMAYVSGTISQGINFTTTNVRLIRHTGGIFDTTAFDSTSYNRGWITIWYEV